MNFNHPYHQKIARILRCLNPDLFKQAGAYFGGGTRLTLQYGEYRWSKDMDFVCPVGEGYRRLRQSVQESEYQDLFDEQNDFELPRPITADQYGIRFPVKVNSDIIKFEIFAESRISLGRPEYPEWSPVPCLNLTDSYAEKLLANTDRWADSAIESRDLIDLCALRFHAPIPQDALDKAENAYPVIKPLIASIQHFQGSPEYRQRCFDSLDVKNPPLIIDGLDLLAADFEMEKTKRRSHEAKHSDQVH